MVTRALFFIFFAKIKMRPTKMPYGCFSASVVQETTLKRFEKPIEILEEI